MDCRKARRKMANVHSVSYPVDKARQKLSHPLEKAPTVASRFE